MPPSRRLGLQSVLALALLLRVALPAAALLARRDPGVFQYPDSVRYLALADSLAHEGTFRFQGEPEIFRPPGYPLLLSIGAFVGHPYLVAVLLQICLGVLTVYLTFRIALLVGWDQRSALLAALACASEPVLLFHASALLSETLFVALLMLAVVALLELIASPSAGRLVVSAVLVSSLAYVRTIAYFLPLWIALILMPLAIRRRDPGLRPLHVMVFLGVSGILLGAWQVRNGLTSGYFGFSTQLDRALYFGIGAPVTAAREGVALEEVRARFQDALGGPNEGYGPSPTDTYSRMRRQGLLALGRRPQAYIGVYFLRLLATVLDPGATGYWRLFGGPPKGIDLAFRNGGVAAAWDRLRTMEPSWVWMATWVLAIAWTLPYLVLPALALVRRSWPEPSRLGVVLAVGIYFLVLSGTAAPSSRYRAPFMPLVSVLMGCELGRRKAT